MLLTKDIIYKIIFKISTVTINKNSFEYADFVLFYVFILLNLIIKMMHLLHLKKLLKLQIKIKK